MKKIIMGIIISCMLFSQIGFSAEEETKIKNVSLGEVLDDPKNVIYEASNDKKTQELTISKDKYSREASSIAPLFSSGKKYCNEVFDMDMEFDISGDDWNAFQLRAKENNKYCWMNECYAIIVKKDRIEIQGFKDGKNPWLLNRAFELPQGEKINVKYGAINTSEGVYLFIKIGDTVFGAVDYDNLIKEEGYLNFEYRSAFTAYDIKPSENCEVYCERLLYLAKENHVNLQTVLKNDIKERKWYISNETFLPSVKEQGETDFLDMFDEIEWEDNEKLLITASDIGHYVVSQITLNDGTSQVGEPVYVSPVEYAIERGYVGCVDYNTAFVKGNYIKYDNDNSDVCANITEDTVYIPVRNVLESYGYTVAWDQELQTVYVDTKNKERGDDYKNFDTAFKIGEQGWKTFQFLMGGTMSHKTVVKNNRTEMVYTALAALMNYNNVIYDENAGVIVFTTEKLSFSKDEFNKLAELVEFGIE